MYCNHLKSKSNGHSLWNVVIRFRIKIIAINCRYYVQKVLININLDLIFLWWLLYDLHTEPLKPTQSLNGHFHHWPPFDPITFPLVVFSFFTSSLLSCFVCVYISIKGLICLMIEHCVHRTLALILSYIYILYTPKLYQIF